MPHSQNKRASASRLTAAKVLDTSSRWPGMSGEANGALSSYTQEKMSDASRFLNLLETGCPTTKMWTRFHRNRRPKLLDNIEETPCNF